MPLSYVPPDQPTAEFYNTRASETFRLYTSAPYPYEKTYSEIIPYASVFWIWKVGNPDSQKWMGIVWNEMYFMKRSQSA